MGRGTGIHGKLRPSTLLRASNAERLIFGFLEHLRETRFGVPKITSFVTPPISKVLENQAVSPTACSKNARIRAGWVKFPKSAIANLRRTRRGYGATRAARPLASSAVPIAERVLSICQRARQAQCAILYACSYH